MDAIHGRTNGHSRCRGGGDASEFGKKGPDSASFSDSLIRVEYDGVIFWRNMLKINSYTFNKKNEKNDNRKSGSLQFSTANCSTLEQRRRFKRLNSAESSFQLTSLGPKLLVLQPPRANAMFSY